MTSKSRFCEACPARLTTRPAEPCPRALERIHAIQAEGPRSKVDPDSLPGCPWAINSTVHNYCFWSLAAELDEPLSDREICNLLGINQQTLEKTLQSAILKLQVLKDTDVMNEFVEAVMEVVATQDPDNTVYLPDSYTKAIEVTPDEPEEDEDAKLVDDKPKRRDNSLPMHRSGNKRDIYGIYGKKKLEDMLRKKREAKK